MVRRMAFALVATAAVVVGLGTGTAAAQSVDDIVALNYKSKGGDKWKAIQSMKQTGVASAQGFELGMVVYSKRPNMGRQELTIAIPGQPAMTMVNVFDGQRAWMLNPMAGSDTFMEMSGAEADTVRDQSDFDGALIDYKTKGSVVELVGPSTVGSRKAHHLKVTRKDKTVQHYHIDVETGVELKVVSETPMGAVETELGDYKAIDGIQIPHSVKVMQGGMVMAELRISKVELNATVDDALFKVR